SQPALIDQFAVTAAQTLLGTINMVRDFSPINNLSTGRMITWGQVGRGVFQIVIVMGGTMGLLGVIILSRRELANAKSF
ncbi:MAG: hypothetical protein HOI66_10700, partial [Verrucomicrobia bacterium]|nr:hypothetical protein [Verrucomicrobiota bacterium]